MEKISKSIFFMFILCLFITNCDKKEKSNQQLLEKTNITQNQNIEVPNPFIEVKTLDEAYKIAGFTLLVPKTYQEYKIQLIQVIENDMIEVKYLSEESGFEGLCIRKAKGTDDISGDYNEYRNIEMIKVGDYEVTEKSDKKDIFVATWTDGSYSYAIKVDRAKLNAEDISKLIQNIK